MVYCPQVGELRTANLADATFTISKPGMYGVDAFYAIQKPLPAAIPGVGRLAKRVIPIDGRSAVRATRVLSLSFDHRVIDGARGARFLETLTGFIEQTPPLLE